MLPSEHLVDAGYTDGEHIVTSLKRYGVELIGPVESLRSWQTKAAQGFDSTQFQIDWDHQVVTCPQGNRSRKWAVKQDKITAEVIRAQFSKKECLACPVRSQCTHALVNPRQIVFRSRAQYEAIAATRKLQTTPKFKERYARAIWH